MEIVLSKFSYIENKSSSIEMKYFDSVDVKIEEGKIVAFVNDDLSILGKLLLVIKRPSSGVIRFDSVRVSRSSHIHNSKSLRRRMGYLNMDTEVMFLESSVKKEITEVLKGYDFKGKEVEKRIIDSLKLAGLNESYLDRNPNELSFVEQKKVKFACIMSYNPEVLILNDFEKGLSYKERDYFRKLFIKLKTKYNKTIVLISRKVEFLFDFVDKVYVINKGKVVLEGGQEIFYDNKLYKYVDVPKIVEFTNFLHSEKHDINKYTDFKELIKELYRRC
jgi:energy-coupling factor transport system ATP-binding protein